MSKPLIGLSPAYYEHKEMDRSILGRSYTESVQRSGGLPVIIPPFLEKKDLKALLSKLDGVVLTGGDDMDPSYYGEAAEPLTPKPFHPIRGSHDRQLFNEIWDKRIPTLAICLGMQEVNVFLGGTLYQDISTQVEKPLVHRIGDWFEARHDVTLDPGSRLAEVAGARVVDANSAHHQAICKVPDELHVVGRCEDGIIEALEPRDPDRPLLAVQWHPESETNDRIGIDLFRWLVQQAV